MPMSERVAFVEHNALSNIYTVTRHKCRRIATVSQLLLTDHHWLGKGLKNANLTTFTCKMVQIVIPATQLHPQSTNGASPNDWIMIELQGTLAADGSDDMAGLELGKIELKANGIPYLYIANHKLEGQRVELKKPLALIRKRRTMGGMQPPDGVLDTMDGIEPSADPSITSQSDSFPSLPPPVHLNLSLSSIASDPSLSVENVSLADQPNNYSEATADLRPGGLVGETDSHQATEALGQAEYDVVTIVRYKYLFKSRPDYVLEEKYRGLTDFAKG
ncbi:uncharacterized protein SPPG_03956 [Spizellomyces punctatus DAOM BR117]|uniref:Uncharacterized protein n=1 Tax=Spizellomyces punctatus (strain DAOM BR117) TaxID=645134 RepID=A0A0L0HI99_SPIPD|nr:uncharacterized protein SPPG_03956 [Spizellomyces punctatus DAOM BR117]KND00852.1 hypothetical protein SPPG_03956 [Spizellomyces punctatus DAOM BR117]|eukprot:XP_016608891.1 hypothetical protein SPPG_03956 [Spizellomyces punctatus DAOM BR117]